MTVPLFLLSGLLGLVAVILAIPAALFCLEIAAAHRPRSRPSPLPPSRDRRSLAVVVPAHDEERHLGATLDSVRAQLLPDDRLVVVADNCTDRTAEVAAAAGAEVVVRQNPFARGKGYAMDAGIRHLQAAAPHVVVFVDADCHLGTGALDALAGQALAHGRPVQARYLCLAPPGARPGLKVAEFAFFVKNALRPRGLAALGLPCQLTGSGMAFPWPIIAQARLDSGEIVEDLKLGLDCALAGHAPMLCDAALVTSRFPTAQPAVASQRERWQRGHLGQIRTALPQLITGLRRGDRACVAQMLDAMVPPLTLLLLANAALVAIAAAAAVAGASPVPFAIGAASAASLTVAIVAGWRLAGAEGHGGGGPRALMAYLAGNAVLYQRLLARTPVAWTRTDRSGTP
ncbi:hypothetical protein ASF22_09020 [Methylobacterium sp. Leaf87]|uniref:glycosyltransferase family 2 protein n=1 Tax=Methylobacterium sp. Leaf87 TaxID=1736243 RepID=UPI0006FC6047|nr:glycosyltransferase family 2 protein [Methylobacterium sp. Leaf87]KQO56673.1 hypothetical protein ASF22_09020 [Methylobacterium sp. Leaf87]